MEYRQDSENTTPNLFPSQKNPINVNQPGITVLFLFDMVWASLVKSMSAAPIPPLSSFEGCWGNYGSCQEDQGNTDVTSQPRTIPLGLERLFFHIHFQKYCYTTLVFHICSLNKRLSICCLQLHYMCVMKYDSMFHTLLQPSVGNQQAEKDIPL